MCRSKTGRCVRMCAGAEGLQEAGEEGTLGPREAIRVWGAPAMALLTSPCQPLSGASLLSLTRPSPTSPRPRSQPSTLRDHRSRQQF